MGVLAFLLSRRAHFKTDYGRYVSIRLRKTDWLIEQMVYRLYGLTEEETKIIEGHRRNSKPD